MRPTCPLLFCMYAHHANLGVHIIQLELILTGSYFLHFPPSTQKYLYPYGTAIFAVLCALFWLYLYIYLPETKGQSVEDVTEEFRRKLEKIHHREIDPAHT